MGYRVICSPDEIRMEGERKEKQKAQVQLPGERTGKMGTRGEVCKLETRDVVEVSEGGWVIGRWDGRTGGQEERQKRRPSRGGDEGTGRGD